VPIHVFTVGYNEDAHNLVLVIDSVDNPIVATGDTVSILVMRLHLTTSARARGNPQLFDGLENLLVFATGTPANFFQHLREIIVGVIYSEIKHCFSNLYMFIRITWGIVSSFSDL